MRTSFQFWKIKCAPGLTFDSSLRWQCCLLVVFGFMAQKWLQRPPTEANWVGGPLNVAQIPFIFSLLKECCHNWSRRPSNVIIVIMPQCVLDAFWAHSLLGSALTTCDWNSQDTQLDKMVTASYFQQLYFSYQSNICSANGKLIDNAIQNLLQPFENNAHWLKWCDFSVDHLKCWKRSVFMQRKWPASLPYITAVYYDKIAASAIGCAAWPRYTLIQSPLMTHIHSHLREWERQSNKVTQL